MGCWLPALLSASLVLGSALLRDCLPLLPSLENPSCKFGGGFLVDAVSSLRGKYSAEETSVVCYRP
uniref:Uncharacterized protein n=1 Tax=Anguilla anguilla TaxID=7936 RepID=A0A0E9WRZ1_ANGAN